MVKELFTLGPGIISANNPHLTAFRINKKVREGPFCATAGLFQGERKTA
jgi:hypothetical protein